ncbi:gluconeogenesis factor YvcK family protein [Geosporobacter ferrireducens]|uniref:Putative gluconeogenesis factor n=1 Tax=Geosporobacter ferrireducens TaxID=1424294 RepID=A0A1D8GLI7_9FIRM|nr:YvcK family protein [Geosporobacter ferrireducens]AOT71773.1 2-phospho-L-lactate transferase [Geosporobacter ferrireducens]MTI55560.1 YvcK family protein [Geosporobacter ferrireducens]
MNLTDWLKPGLKIKRWVALGVLGIFLVSMGVYPIISFLLGEKRLTSHAFMMLFVGALFVGIAVKRGILSILTILDIPGEGTSYRSRIDKKLYDKRILMRGPKIVVVGGGTGLSVLLRGIKKYTLNITAIVTVADDGGGSGKLREDLGMLPPGDIRNCILALADTEPIMEQLLQYRFTEGSLKGQSFGNLLIAAMNGISDNFEEAIGKINDVLAVTGKVLPVTTEDITLYGKLKNGKVIKGESQIPIKVKEYESEIDQVFIKPDHVKPLKEAVEAIQNADVVILGPGSLYTSVIPNLLVRDIAEAIKKTSALRVYVANVMTQPGETDDYGVWKHLEAIFSHIKEQVVDYVFVNNEAVPLEVLEKYKKDGASPVVLNPEDQERIAKAGIKIKEGKFLEVKKQYIRHDTDKLSEQIIKLALEEKYATDKIRILDYYYFHEKLKKLSRI